MAYVLVEEEGNLGVAISPKETTPNGVVSLFAMMRFYAEKFFALTKALIALEAVCHVKNRQESQNVVGAQLRAQIYANVGVFAVQCKTMGLPNSAQKCARIHGGMDRQKDQVTYQDCGSWLKDLRERVEDELHSLYFLQLTNKEADLYEQSPKQWESAINRFPKIRIDVEESAKCFALHRFAACLFHILLVAEFGVIEVAKLFEVQGDKPGWGALDRLQRIHEKKWSDKTTFEQQHSELLGKILPLMLSTKNEWRHKISHVDNKLEWVDTDFSPDVAERIVSATLGFMLCLASDLPGRAA